MYYYKTGSEIKRRGFLTARSVVLGRLKGRRGEGEKGKGRRRERGTSPKKQNM